MEEDIVPLSRRPDTPVDNQIAEYKSRLYQVVTEGRRDDRQALVDEVIAWAQQLSPMRQYRLFQEMAETLLAHQHFALAEHFLTAQLQLNFLSSKMRGVIFILMSITTMKKYDLSLPPPDYMDEARQLMGRRQAVSMLESLKRQYRA